MRFSRTASALAVAAAAAGVQADMFAASYTQNRFNFTLSAIYDSSANATHFELTSGQVAQGGWVGIGTGQQMQGSSMVISWVNPDKTVTLSQRHAKGEFMPSVTGLTLPAISVNQSASATGTAAGTTFAWTQPGFPNVADTSAVNMIWAVNNENTPPSSASDAMLLQHQNYGFITLNLAQPYNAGSGAPQPAPASDGDDSSTLRILNRENKLIIAHMVLAIVAWLILVPAGIFIGRFGRTTMVWFPKHRAVQLASIAMILIAMGLGFAAVDAAGDENFSETHYTLGFVLSMLAVFQGILGQVGHMLWHAKHIRALNFLHIIIGVALFGLAPWNIVLGFNEWTPWNPSPAGKWICVAWAALLAVIYLAGLALIPRERRANRKAQAVRAGIASGSSEEVLAQKA